MVEKHLNLHVECTVGNISPACLDPAGDLWSRFMHIAELSRHAMKSSNAYLVMPSGSSIDTGSESCLL